PFEPCASAERGLHHCTALAGQFAVSDTTFGGPRPGEALFSFLRARSSLLKIIIALSNMGVVPGARSAPIWPDRPFPWRPLGCITPYPLKCRPTAMLRSYRRALGNWPHIRRWGSVAKRSVRYLSPYPLPTSKSPGGSDLGDKPVFIPSRGQTKRRDFAFTENLELYFPSPQRLPSPRPLD